ncbi:MAG: hypothetical protein KGO94_07190 [Alphaproteobacteria bacterium]|nr:hypothetical protein [Alphaproteobacteria bacterium]
MVFRNAEGAVVYDYISAAVYVGTFTTLSRSPVKTQGEMHNALVDWIATANSSIKLDTMKDFPEWKSGAESPDTTKPSEFPFTVDSEITREDYLKWQQQNRPVFCFVQGLESAKCLVLTREKTLVEIGIQSFPG